MLRRVALFGALLLLFYVVSNAVGFEFLDEQIYIKAGKEQVRGMPPALSSNPEHPPLAKYLIGLWPRSPLAAGAATLLLAGWMARLMGRRWLSGVL